MGLQAEVVLRLLLRLLRLVDVEHRRVEATRGSGLVVWRHAARQAARKQRTAGNTAVRWMVVDLLR